MKKKPPIRPGLVLKKMYLDSKKMTVDELAEKIDLRRQDIDKLIKAKLSITPEIAIKLSKVFENQPEFWVNLQTAYDLWYAEGNRGTDEPFYKLMKLSGEAILKFIGASHTSGYEAKAVVLKEKSLYPDIMAVPKDQDKNYERIFIEFQGYYEQMIRYITSSKVTMSCAQDQYTGPVLICIIYTDQKYKDYASPLLINSISGKSFINGQFIEIVLTDYSENELIEIDPKLIVLAPFTVSKNIKKEKLAQKCYNWKKIALSAYQNDENVSSNQVIDVMALFIINKFKKLSIKEVRAMLDFDLSDTKAGEELIEIGREEGRVEGEIKTYQELINNSLLPENMINQFNHKIAELQNKLQKINETYAAV